MDHGCVAIDRTDTTRPTFPYYCPLSIAQACHPCTCSKSYQQLSSSPTTSNLTPSSYTTNPTSSSPALDFLPPRRSSAILHHLSPIGILLHEHSFSTLIHQTIKATEDQLIPFDSLLQHTIWRPHFLIVRIWTLQGPIFHRTFLHGLSIFCHA